MVGRRKPFLSATFKTLTIMETIWHNLRHKPKPYEYVLVETYTKRRHYRICIMFEDGVWKDMCQTSYYFPQHLKKEYCNNGFRVKKWAYIKDIK